MSFVQEDVSLGDGNEQTDWVSFQVVFLAALVGMDTPSKLGILSDLARKLRPGTLVVTRSAQGLRGVLYPVSQGVNSRDLDSTKKNRSSSSLMISRGSGIKC